MDELISWEDNRPYHVVPLYQSLFSLYIGIQTRFLSPSPETPSVSVAKASEVDPSYQSCDIPRKLFPIKKPIFHLIESSYDYFMEGANDTYPIRFAIHHDILIVSFGTGRKTILTTLDEAIPSHDDWETVESDDDEPLAPSLIRVDSMEPVSTERDNMKAFLSTIERIATHFHAQTLLLCGHSHGMRSATVASFFIEAMLDNEFAQHHTRICGSFLEEGEYSFSEYRALCPSLGLMKRMVVGTGGAPVLFTAETEMKSYFEQMGGRYAHIVAGIQRIGEEEVQMDFRCAPLTPTLCNYRYQCYYHVFASEVKNRYQDQQCFAPVRRRFLSPEVDSDMSLYQPYMFTHFWEVVDHFHLYDVYRTILSIFFFGDAPYKKRVSVLSRHLGKRKSKKGKNKTRRSTK